MRANLLIGVPEISGHDFGIGQNRHEVGIPIPARHDMQVNMISNAGSCNCPLIDTHIETMWRERCSYRGEATLRGRHDIRQCWWVELFDGGYMLIGGNHEVAVVIRVDIHQNEAEIASVQQEIFFIAPLGGLGAEDTSFILLLAGFDVCHTPWSPKMVHSRGPFQMERHQHVTIYRAAWGAMRANFPLAPSPRGYNEEAKQKS